MEGADEALVRVLDKIALLIAESNIIQFEAAETRSEVFAAQYPTISAELLERYEKKRKTK